MLRGGWSVNDAGRAAWSDLGAAAVPATAVFLGGAAYAQDGTRYCTTQAIAAGDVFISGLRHRQDGALRVRTTDPAAAFPLPPFEADADGVMYVLAAAPQFFSGGLGFRADGALAVQ